MKKIVHVMISNFYIEGAGYQENLLPRAHKRMGYDVTIITSQFCFNSKNEKGKREACTYINNDGIKVIILEDNVRYPIISHFQPCCNGIVDTLKLENPDIIFMHNLGDVDSYIVAKYASKNNTILYCDNHADFYNTKSKGILRCVLRHILRIPIARYISKNSKKIWGTTPWRVQFLQDFYKIDADKTDFLVMGADEQLINWNDKDIIRANKRLKYGFSDDDFIIITGGKINREKNIHLLAEAVKEIGPPVKLLIFGNPDDDIKPELEASLSTNIINIGWISSNDVYDLFLASDLGFFPGTHSVLWEQAIACGLPTVFKLWEGMKHVNVNGNAILLNNPSVASIKKTILALQINANLYNTMREKASLSREDFMYCNIAKKAIGID